MTGYTVLFWAGFSWLAMLAIVGSREPGLDTPDLREETQGLNGQYGGNITGSTNNRYRSQRGYSWSEKGLTSDSYSSFSTNTSGFNTFERNRLLELQLSRYAQGEPIAEAVFEALEDMEQWLDIPEEELHHLQQDEPLYSLSDQQQQQRRGASKHKVEYLGVLLRKRVEILRQTPNQRVELIFLVDSSTTVGPANFDNELIFVRKLLADFTVDRHTTRVAVVTFSSQDRVVRHVDHLRQSDDVHNKCSLLEEELSRIRYTGGGTDTLGAFQEAERVLADARPGAHKVIFLITDGYSNYGDPRPLAARLRDEGVEVFTIGIMHGNTLELNDMASEPKEEHAYLLGSFMEFEALARRALHKDLHRGDYLRQPKERCNGLCEEGHHCCDSKATCRCGTHVGRYECICRVGYYGDGLNNGCKACPSGTYKSHPSPGDSSSCVRCPDANHISKPGSTSRKACVCKPGYRDAGNRKCAAMTCPKLKPPDHGYFVKECDNVVHAACGVKCEPGYRLVGKSVRLCQENGQWSGRHPRCEVKKCRPLKSPTHGSMKCSEEGFTFKTTCQFSCDEGYQLVGSNSRTCFALGFWDGISAKCREVTCPALPELIDGQVFNPKCTKQRMPVGTMCLLKCNQGYRITGYERKMCGAEGSWKPVEESESRCFDVQPPWIACPRNVSVETTVDENVGVADWAVPTAVDNSGILPTLNIVPATAPPARFPIGITMLTYVAEDRSKNRATCQFYVSVRDTQPPRVDRCVSPRPFLLKGQPVKVRWHRPLFSDNSNEPLKIVQSHKPGKFPVGVTFVRYTAVDKSGNNNTCKLRIVVQEDACAHPDPPHNGQVRCSRQFNGVTCQLQCNYGYGFAIQPAKRYFCDLNTGYWLPVVKMPFPDCSVSRVPTAVVQSSHIVFSASTQCDDRIQLNKIEASFDNQLRQKLGDYCGPPIYCRMETVNTRCTPQFIVDDNDIESNIIDAGRPRRRPGSNDLRSLTLGQDGRTVRSAPVVEHSLLDVEFNIKGALLVESVEVEAAQAQSTQTELMDAMHIVMDKVSKAASRGEFDSAQLDQHVEYSLLSIEGSDPRFKCPSGSVLRNSSCVKCPVGTFYNVVSEECSSCSVGTYQPQEGQNTCLVCPNNTSTVSNNSKSVNECKGQCLPGTFSEDGLERCETCPVGSYQPQYAQADCTPCPGTNTTWQRGSRSVVQCAAKCSAGYVSKTGLNRSPDLCLSCPRGYYQPDTGQTNCILCPGNVRTLNKASTNISDCQGISQIGHEQKNIPIERLVVNECFADPCQNGASCESFPVGYQCHCEEGWTGVNCGAEVDECESHPCLNNGTCKDEIGAYSCSCRTGFTGSSCEINIEECASGPCRNNATCEDGINAYHCRCPPGYNGTNCEENIDECLPEPCLNGGVCLDQVAMFECTCPPGFVGSRCEINPDDCESLPCENNATCIDDINSVQCQCWDGYMGEFCEQEVDECSSSPCLNGATCLDGVNNYVCVCAPSYSGIHCDIKLNSSFDMAWPKTGPPSYMLLECCQMNMTAITVAFWIETTDKTNFGTPLSYATEKHDNELSVTDYNGFTLYISGENKVTDVEVSDGRWHHITVTWSRRQGHWEIYLDGIKEDEGDGLAKGAVIEGGGVYVVGQDQDARGSNFTSREALVGSLSRVNIWDWVLPSEEVSLLATSCSDDHVGSVVAWPDFLRQVHGAVQRTESVFCKGCDAPAPISRGNVTFNGTVTESSVAVYSCDPGYVLVGQNYQRCRISSNWDGRTPRCQKKRCPNPSSIRHGYVKGPWFHYGATIRYHCLTGFRLAGNATRYCNESGSWEGFEPSCEAVSCPPITIVKPLQSRDLQEVYTYRDEVGFSCADEYRLEGRSVITCDESGQWNSQLPTCKRITCPEPPVVPHAVLADLVSSSEGVAEYVCEEGYTMEGRNVVHCQPMGTWEAYRPRCRLITCLTPSDIPHGYITNDTATHTYGASVVYECDKGFVLKGVAKLVCQETGVWNSTAPVCEPLTCPEPDVPSNGSVVALSYLFRAIVTYSCDPGYQLNGNLRRICRATGVWSGLEPSCDPVSCPTPTNITHGFITGSSYTFQSNIFYSCQKGFNLEGTQDRQCNADGQWTNSLPRCVPRQCPQPNKVNHGQIIGSSFQFQSTVDYACDTGYYLVGDKRRTCEWDGAWSGNTPICKRTKCHRPKAFQNGIISSTAHEYDPGETLKYVCNIGFEIRGKVTRTCKIDGTWTGRKPKCDVLFCRKPAKINNGYVLASDMSYGAMAEYACDEGYQLDGPITRMCSADKRWSGSEPACDPVVCSKPPSIIHGRVTGIQNELNSEISYTCNTGYRLEGYGIRTCLMNKTWSGQAPWCKPIDCTKPANRIPNGRMISTNFSYGNTIRYVCDTGYFINHPDSRTCGPDGRWNSTVPTCKPVKCMLPSPPPHSIIEGSEFYFKQEVRYRCKVGYKLSGPETRTCQADRTWNDEEPRCIQIECNPPADIENGYVVVKTTYFRDKAIYKCNIGYYLLGDPHVICQEDGTWFNQLPRCLQVKCIPPPGILHGIVMNDHHYVFYGDVVQYRCDPGYVLSASSMMTCSQHGNYTGEQPKCVQIQCDPPEQVDNADVVGGSETLSMGYGDTIEYVCLQGFELHGNQYRRCNAEGRWSGRAPQCSFITCPSPGTIPNGSFNASAELFYGQRVVYSCNEGHVLYGNKIRKCESNRTWSGTEPRCQQVQCSFPLVDFGYVDFGEAVEPDAYQTVNEELRKKFDYDVTVSILCEDGFVLKGQGEIKCGADADWSPSLPSCQRRKCPPLIIKNGMASHKEDVPFETMVNVSCLEGFRLLGKASLICPSDGAWKRPLPECILVTCRAPVFRNGNVTVLQSPNRGVGYPYGITLKFECGIGFDMSGDNLVTCQDDGQWSGDIPKCNAILCSSPHIPVSTNAIVATYGHRFQYGEAVVIGCKEGYESPGPRELECDHDGTWKGFIPTCSVRQCSTPKFVNGQIYGRGRRRLTTFKTDEIVSFRCDRGWRLSGRSEVVCLANKTWSSETPVCKKVRCPNIEIDNGQIVSKHHKGNFFVYGMKATFVCRDGYELKGNDTVACDAAGRWSGDLPVCVRVTCYAPVINNGRLQSALVRYKFEDRVDIICDEGYRPSEASQSLTCQADGTWSTESPSCLIIFCPTLRVNNGEVKTVHPNQKQVPGMNVFGQTIQFKCTNGYRRVGQDFSVCQANGTWSHNAPQCQRILCPQLSITNGRVINARAASLTLGSRVAFQCLVGYELIGDSQRICVRNGEWSGLPAKCSPKECPSPSIQHGRVIGNSPHTKDYRYTFGDSIRFVCDDGYELVGESEMTCQADRAWSVHFPPRCNAIMCPPLPRILNGQVTISDQGQFVRFPLNRHARYGTNVEVACMPGYQLDEGDSRLTCGLDKDWMGKVPKCRSMHCPSFTVENGHVVGQPSAAELYGKDDVVRLVCDEGYQLTSDNTELTCLENGTWSAPYPRCTRKRCKDLVLQNGQIIGDSFLFGDMVKFQCNEGYGLLGKPTCTCQSNGFWGCMPLCFRISCPRPSSILHGSYEATGFHYGDRLRYKCEDGYDLVSEVVYVCQANMEWTGDTPACQRTSCPEPEVPQNGLIIGDSFQYGDRIEYKCEKNHKLVGNQFAECMADRSWGPVPSCVRISCSHPGNIRNGRLEIGTFYVDDIVTYVCNEGYRLSGSPSLQCGENGLWKSTVPQCLYIECPAPQAIPNGFVLGTQYRYKSTIEYHCKRGYRLQGNYRRECTADGTWKGDEPRCHVIMCSSPGPLANGHISIESYDFASVINYKCDYGYYITGDATRICQEDGVWTGIDPHCELVECSTPERIEHGYYSAIDNKVDSMLFYMCDPEYSLQGTPQRTCLENGTWSGEAPRCVVKSCPTPPKVENGKAVGHHLTPGSVVSFTCNDGFRLSGAERLTCEDGERWSQNYPVCERISCGPPRDIEHGFYDDTAFGFEDTVSYLCHPGYFMEGIASITCQVTGYWSPIEARCSKLGCGPTPVVENSVHTRYPCDFGECVYYSCDSGYELNGNYLIQCGRDGTWRGPFPTCHKITCGQVPVIHHSSNIVTEATDGSLVIEYICNHGYILRGSPMLHCMPNGTWMYDNKPSCLPLDCGPAPEVQHSLVLVPEHTVGNIARYTCHQGFTMQGHPNLRCQEDGSWNGTGPMCVGGECPVLEDIDHGFINTSDHSYGSTADYICDRGYILNGASNRTCRVDGRWSGTAPYCSAVECTPRDAPDFGHVSTSAHHYGVVITVTCDPGFLLLGNSSVTCLETGSWDSPLPRCSLSSASPCSMPPLPDHANTPVGPFHVGDVITLTCEEGYMPSDSLELRCDRGGTWTQPAGHCRVSYCGPPRWSNPALVIRLLGRSYSYGSKMVYSCRNGLSPATEPILTCTGAGVWSDTPRCVASCKFECKNGGTCIGANKCKCLSGYSGRFCQEAICILQCLNGGRCTAPYHCECPYGYTGPRCQKAKCDRPCSHGGRCIRPNRCQCPRGYKPPFCEEINPVFSIDTLHRT